MYIHSFVINKRYTSGMTPCLPPSNIIIHTEQYDVALFVICCSFFKSQSGRLLCIVPDSCAKHTLESDYNISALFLPSH